MGGFVNNDFGGHTLGKGFDVKKKQGAYFDTDGCLAVYEKDAPSNNYYVGGSNDLFSIIKHDLYTNKQNWLAKAVARNNEMSIASYKHWGKVQVIGLFGAEAGQMLPARYVQYRLLNLPNPLAFFNTFSLQIRDCMVGEIRGMDNGLRGWEFGRTKPVTNSDLAAWVKTKKGEHLISQFMQSITNLDVICRQVHQKLVVLIDSLEEENASEVAEAIKKVNGALTVNAVIHGYSQTLLETSLAEWMPYVYKVKVELAKLYQMAYSLSFKEGLDFGVYPTYDSNEAKKLGAGVYEIDPMVVAAFMAVFRFKQSVRLADDLIKLRVGRLITDGEQSKYLYQQAKNLLNVI